MKKIFLVLLLISSISNAQVLAFPSALGDGAYTTGGRGGTVLHVNTLAGDVSNTDSTHGSLRWACSQTYPRIIVFDVSGVIVLDNNLSIQPDCTIAGQTAPEGGITIDGDRYYSDNNENIIIRYIRFKGGVKDGDDSLTIRGNIDGVLIDHCTFSFGIDEGASFYGASTSVKTNNVTIQRCLWNENVKGAIIGIEQYTTSAPLPSVSFISNMFYNSGYRFPNIASNGAGQFDVINNISWNIGDRLIRAEGANGMKINHIGNYYHFGSGQVQNKRTNLYSYRSGAVPSIYNSNNKIVGSEATMHYTVAEMNTDGDKSWGFFQDAGGYLVGDRLPSNYFTAIQHNLLGETFTPLTADQALIDVRNNVGCNVRLNADGTVSSNLDTMDANALSNVSAGTYSSKIAKASYIVDPVTSYTRAAGYDTDNDGMPNTWEIANGLDENVDDSADNDLDVNYTNIEMFINSVDTPVATVGDIPVITLIGNPIVNINLNDSYTDLGATATDTEDGSLTGSIVTTGSVDNTVAGTYYIYYNVTDSDSNAATQKSRTVNVNDPSDTENPTTPTNANVTSITNTTATVSWDASTDNVAVSGYYIKDGATTISDVTGGTTYNFTGLTANTSYTYSIVAYDGNGNESSALSFSFTTTNTSTPPPSNNYGKGKSNKSVRKLLMHY